jgi:hypothetical protein
MNQNCNRWQQCYKYLYAKPDDFNISIVNFPHLCSNILLAHAYSAYISHLTRYAGACSANDKFSIQGRQQTYWCEVVASVSSTVNIKHIYHLSKLCNNNPTVFMPWMNSRQGTLRPPRHLVPPCKFSFCIFPMGVMRLITIYNNSNFFSHWVNQTNIYSPYIP